MAAREALDFLALVRVQVGEQLLAFHERPTLTRNYDHKGYKPSVGQYDLNEYPTTAWIFIWPHSIAVITLPSHGSNTGSSPVGVTNIGVDKLLTLC